MKNVMSKIKKLTAGVLAVGMLVAGIVVLPKQAEATEANDATTVICEAYTDSVIKEEKYWTETSKTAPLKSGYVFGGWFRTATVRDNNSESLTCNGIADNYAPLTAENMADILSDDTVDTLYAKFVPAQVLSVKAQNGVGPENTAFDTLTEETAAQINEDNPVWIRVISSLDSDNYQNWGFDIYLANKIKVEKNGGGECITTKKYEGLLQGDESKTTTEKSAEEIFGASSDYVFVWQLNKINHKNNVGKIIYVRPYWHTMDGTKVLGLAKYVHMEDEYLDYISVPVNLQSAKEIAAGTMTMSYDYEGLELISTDESKYFEAGRILPEMKVYHNTTSNTFSMAGNAADVDEYNSGETIYANIRFKKPTIDVDLNFYMTLGEYCNWKEETVRNENMKVWDIAYEIKAPTN